ncbi:calcium-binding protein [Actinomadura sp. NTSP31]|uniref:calcium-binding protein n=1 Tax=Actinomadura sp. NTSP31 TaxID=1735447 RepID=UPI0035BF2185
MSIHDRTSSRMRAPRNALRILAVAAGLASLPCALAAQPAMASPCYGDCHPGVVRLGAGVLRYDAPVGVNDQITIGSGGGFVTLTDTTATFTAGDGCTMVTAHQAQCTSAYSIRVRGLDGDDAITNATALNADLLGGTGDDRLTGGSGDDVLTGEYGADVLMGGGGSDTANYDDSAGRTAGVRADLDGAAGDDGGPEDGLAGARDTIGADVENLQGTIKDDVLIGNAGPNVVTATGGHDQIQGLGGNDQLTGRGGGTVNGGAGTDGCVSDLRGLPEQPDTFVGCESTQVMT